jgi:hypothetical protein
MDTRSISDQYESFIKETSSPFMSRDQDKYRPRLILKEQVGLPLQFVKLPVALF